MKNIKERKSYKSSDLHPDSKSYFQKYLEKPLISESCINTVQKFYFKMYIKSSFEFVECSIKSGFNMMPT